MTDPAHLRHTLAALADADLRRRIAADVLAQRRAPRDALLAAWTREEWYECLRRHGDDRLYRAALADARRELSAARRTNAAGEIG